MSAIAVRHRQPRKRDSTAAVAAPGATAKPHSCSAHSARTPALQRARSCPRVAHAPAGLIFSRRPPASIRRPRSCRCTGPCSPHATFRSRSSSAAHRHPTSHLDRQRFSAGAPLSRRQRILPTHIIITTPPLFCLCSHARWLRADAPRPHSATAHSHACNSNNSTRTASAVPIQRVGSNAIAHYTAASAPAR